MSNAQVWNRDDLFSNGDLFFAKLEESFDGAIKSIDLQTYIFKNDELGKRIAQALVRARRRGVAVRLIVDGIGSFGWSWAFSKQLEQADVSYKIYHPLPFELSTDSHNLLRRAGSFLESLTKINSRSHRKVCIIDDRQAWVGSMNISGVHLESVSGANAQRDTGVVVEGADVALLKLSFDQVWDNPESADVFFKKKITDIQNAESSLVRLNSTRYLRRFNYKDFLRRISRATGRVLVTNSYFVPNRRLLIALENAHRNGVDVVVLIPGKPANFFLHCISTALLSGLLESGVKIFEYQARMLHAKTLLVDDWAVVGSSNLNYRSLFHDLEADVVLTSQRSINQLEADFFNDLKSSQQVTLAIYRKRGLIVRSVGRVLLSLRYFF